MKAILLAAGVGSRLKELTKHTPKCLVPIHGRPLLDYWFENLERAEVRDIFMNIHYLPDAVRNFVSESNRSLNVTLFHEEILLGSAGTIAAAKEFVGSDDRFFIIYADNFAILDLNRLEMFHRDRGNPLLSVVTYRTNRPKDCGILEFDANGRVMSFEEKPSTPKTDIANTGIHVASCGLFGEIPAKRPCDLGFDVLPNLVGRMFGYVTDEYIRDIGTPESYQEVNRYMLEEIG